MKISEIIKIALIIYLVLTAISALICGGIALFGGKSYEEAMVLAIGAAQYIEITVMAAIFAVGCYSFISANYKLTHESEEKPLASEEKEKLQKMKNRGINEALAVLLLIVVSVLASYAMVKIIPSQAIYVQPK